jgi:hypothetical protein
MTGTRAPIIEATAVGALAALVAVGLLLGSVASSSTWMGQAGLACLFGVPVVRNIVLVVRTRGLQQALAVVGIIVVVAVAVATFGQTLDPTPVALPTSTQ